MREAATKTHTEKGVFSVKWKGVDMRLRNKQFHPKHKAINTSLFTNTFFEWFPW